MIAVMMGLIFSLFAHKSDATRQAAKNAFFCPGWCRIIERPINHFFAALHISITWAPVIPKKRGHFYASSLILEIVPSGQLAPGSWGFAAKKGWLDLTTLD